MSINYCLVVCLLVSSMIYSSDASIRICNDGAYLAKCYLQSRSANGFQTRSIDTGLFPVAQCRNLDAPPNAIMNRLECKSLAFIAVYKSIFVQQFASSMFNFCYRLTGTTLNPHWSQSDCY